ncbi:hypothetical protein CAPTEDRAFT_214730 [Capitella teleta]|uniref:BACK domain-containing protein n=1 Tax=Capitella teleta TaxID=283909 RepID=R7TKZ0_CAPTE|nr:hypothetical protein CAPTEDRAFT_214730 [Capitella teleta]|eukprot:ELT94187.1 hypothetical protein CAPTEDRAFT_214730 [Capitella teleta]
METKEMHLLQEIDLIEVLEANASQEENFLFIQKWTRSADGRTNRFDDLMQYFSLSKCNKDFVWSTVLEEKQLKFSTRGKKLIQQFMQSYGSANLLKQPSLAVGDEDGEMWLCTDLNTLQWQPLQQPSFQIKYYSACASPGGFVVSGGRSQNGFNQRECYSYDAKNGQWNTLPPMPTARDNLFVLGGCNDEWVADVHEFDLTQQTWRQRFPMPDICKGGAAVCFNDHVYVVGGRNRSCMRFNPRTNTWPSLQRPPSRHNYGSSLVLNGNIVVFGDLNHESIEEYSLPTDSWSKWTLKMPQKSKGWAFASRHYIVEGCV